MSGASVSMQNFLRPLRHYACCQRRQTFARCIQPASFRQLLHQYLNCSNPNVRSYATRPPRKDTRPKSDETTQTDFGQMDIYAATPPPTSGIDACSTDGFALNNGLKVTGSGVFLVGGEAFKWRPWIHEGGQEGRIGWDGTNAVPGREKSRQVSSRTLLNDKGQFDLQKSAWGLLDVVWPKPDLLIIGTGSSIRPLSPATKDYLNNLGIRLEALDTRNASAQYNLLATERGVQQVAAALIPIGWKERQQNKSTSS